MDRNSSLWCHQCKQKHDYVLYCTRNCSKKYCTRCVQRHYNEQIEDIEIEQWVCYYCKGVCTCASCRRRRAKETNTKFESHRGKKWRSFDDESPPSKKRKYKPESTSDKEQDERSKDDSNIIETLNNSTIEQTPRRKFLRKKSDEKNFQNSNNSPSFNPDDTQQTSRKPTLFSRRKRVTLKDLIDSHILSSGDELSFRNSNEFAVLLQDGQILWSDITFKSLSTFAKKVAHLVGAGTKGALYNGWRVVYCRGKVMDSYRKKYERSHKTDEIEESSGSFENSDEEDPESAVEPILDSQKEIQVSQSVEENSKSPILESELFSHNYAIQSSPTAETISMNNPHNSPETWWESDAEENDSFTFGSPIFGIFDGLNPAPEEEQDLLIIGNNVKFLDIGDKDLFNITEDAASSNNNQVSTEGEINNTLLRSGQNESVEDFYNGFDSDY